jgi:ABC-type sugar transport system ATPase subunit
MEAEKVNERRSSGSPLLELRGIGKSFPGVAALADVDFTADAGEVHALAGANGAGKSTLIGLLSGVFAPSTGTMRLAGQEMSFDSPRMATAAGISTVYQELTVLPNLTVAENVFLGREPRTRHGLVDFVRLRRETRGLAERYGLDLDPEARVGRLSIAQRQLVELARALSTASRVLILDEPTAVLSAGEQAVLFRIIATLKRAGLLIIYVSHRLEEIFSLADRVTVLRDGKRVATEAVSAISHRQLVRLMVGHDVRDRFPLPDVAAAPPLLEATISTARGDSRLDIRAGEIVGLAGIVGSGRSRLARALAGLGGNERVSTIIGGNRVLLSSPAAAIAHGIFYMTEDRKGDGLFGNLSVLANTTAGALTKFSRFGLIRGRRERQEAATMLERLRLVARSLDAPVRQLSGGNQQKALFGRALLCLPRLLICDEPTRGVDVGAKDQIYEILIELAARGIGILLVSAEMKELLMLCHRLLVVRAGRIREELSPTIDEHRLVMIASGLLAEE